MNNDQRRALETVCVAFLAAREQGLADDKIYQWIKNYDLSSLPHGGVDRPNKTYNP